MIPRWVYQRKNYGVGGKLAVSQGSNDTEMGLSKKESCRMLEGKLAVSQGSNDTELWDSPLSEEVEKNRER